MKTRIRISVEKEILNTIQKIAERDKRTTAEEIEWMVQQYLLEYEARYYPPKEIQRHVVMIYKIENKK